MGGFGKLRGALVLLIIILFSTNAFGSQLFYLQGKALYQGVLINTGNVTVTIHDAPTGGVEIYNETFIDSVQSGFFDVLLGNNTPLNLNMNQNYWIDVTINDNDIDWQGDERKIFQSSLGNTTEIIGSDNIFPSTGGVGIGTLIPSNKLTVVGDINATTNISTPTLCLDGVCQSTWPTGLGGGGIANKVAFWTNPSTLSYDDFFSWDNTQKRLGLGISTPQETLHVNGTIRINITDCAGALQTDSNGNIICGAQSFTDTNCTATGSCPDIVYSNEVANLNVNSSAYWDSISNQSQITINESQITDLIHIADTNCSATNSCANIVYGLDVVNFDQWEANDLTTTTIFGGDVTGNYTDLVIVDNSHKHDWSNITNAPGGGGVGNITAVYTNGPYLSGGNDSGAVYLLLNETKLNLTIDGRSTDTNCSVTNSCANIVYGLDVVNFDQWVWDDLTTTTNFSGDITGNYTNIAIVDSSHEHDWSNLSNIPSDLADGDDDTTYTHLSNFTDDIGHLSSESDPVFVSENTSIWAGI
ncbi:hypothetical protein GOV05_02440, partial [Candidatus Woesearchaeota archaeon]|nr:hypothetical protein [Candidatus Woesearchaeota archaeon]